MGDRVAVIAGDGVGPEVNKAGVRCLQAVTDLQFDWLDWGCARFEKTGSFMPADGLAALASYRAIYLGAVGWPTVPDHISLWGLLLPIRKRFEQYANIRPARLLPGINGPLDGRGPADIDMLFVREKHRGRVLRCRWHGARGHPDRSCSRNVGLH